MGAYAWPQLPEPLQVRWDGVPWAAQVVEYVPAIDSFCWLDCLGRGHVRRSSWFTWVWDGVPAPPQIELEERVRDWWISA